MNIIQRCSCCTSYYYVDSHVHQTANIIWCPGCGNVNKPQPAIQKKVACNRKAEIYVQDGRKRAPRHGIARTIHRSGIREPKIDNIRTLEELRGRIQDKGRVFVMGTAPSLNDYDLDLILDSHWPTIGVNDVWKTYKNLDCLCLGDYGHIESNLPAIEKWQQWKKGRYIFWMTETRSNRKNLRWVKMKDKHGTCIDRENGSLVCNMLYPLNHSQVYYYNKAKALIPDIRFPFDLLFYHSIIFSAINLAFVLGAKEIILIGVEMDDNSHFWDIDRDTAPKNFPRAEKIFTKFEQVRDELQEFGCQLKTVRSVGRLAKMLPVVNFDETVCPHIPIYLELLRQKIERAGKMFILGPGAGINEMPLQFLCGFPVLGLNSAFTRYPLMDALIFADDGFVKNYTEALKNWQLSREEKPVLFWYRKDGSKSNGFFRTVSWLHQRGGFPILDSAFGPNPTFAILSSIVTCAINCAWWLGAREIYLLGIELDANHHFWDKDRKIAAASGKPDAFPKADRIVDFIVRQAKALEDRNCKLFTCTPTGLLVDKLPFVDFRDATDSRVLDPVYGHLRERKEEK